MSILRAVNYKLIDPAIMSKKRVGGNFVNFSYNHKQDVFCQYKYCCRITKVQNDWYNKTKTPKPSRIIAEMNAKVEHAFTVLNSTKFFILLVLFKNRAKVTLVNAIQTIRRQY